VKPGPSITFFGVAVCALAASAALMFGLPDPKLEQHARTLGLKAPVGVEGIGEYKDGGTVTFTFTDADKRKAPYCFDYSLSSRTRGRLHSGEHPENPGAKIVAFGDAREKAVLAILRSFLDGRFSRADQKGLSKMNGGDVSVRYGDKGRDAWLILRGMKRLQEAKAQQSRQTRPAGRNKRRP
jgi:hypothetical protein